MSVGKGTLIVMDEDTRHRRAVAAAYGLGMGETAAHHYDRFELVTHRHEGQGTLVTWFHRNDAPANPSFGHQVLRTLANTSRVFAVLWVAFAILFTWWLGWRYLALWGAWTTGSILIGSLLRHNTRNQPAFTQAVPASERHLVAVLDHANHATGTRLTGLLADAWEAHRDDLDASQP